MQIKRRKTRFTWIIFSIGALLILLTTWPLPTRHLEWTGNPQTNLLALINLSLDWPMVTRVGERSTAALHIRSADRDVEPTLIQAMITARLEFSGVSSFPSGEVTQPLGMGSIHEFRWDLLTQSNGSFSGTLWLYLTHFTADGAAVKEAIGAYPLKIQSYQFFGVPMGVSRIVGILLVLTAGMLLFPRLPKKIISG